MSPFGGFMIGSLLPRIVVVVTAAAILISTPAVATADAVHLGLPEPTGAHRVGTTSLHLIDAGRPDALAPTERSRELMVQLWYPAAPNSCEPVATYLPAATSAAVTQALNAFVGTDFPADLLTFPTH